MESWYVFFASDDNKSRVNIGDVGIFISSCLVNEQVTETMLLLKVCVVNQACWQSCTCPSFPLIKCKAPLQFNLSTPSSHNLHQARFSPHQHRQQQLPHYPDILLYSKHRSLTSTTRTSETWLAHTFNEKQQLLRCFKWDSNTPRRPRLNESNFTALSPPVQNERSHWFATIFRWNFLKSTSTTWRNLTILSFLEREE